MKTFMIPVTYITVGYIRVTAIDKDEAVAKGKVLDDEGILEFDIEDAETNSSLEVSEIEEML